MCFVKVYAPLDPVLYKKAEEMNIQMPIKDENNHWSIPKGDKSFFGTLYENYKHRDPFVVRRNSESDNAPKTTATTFSKANKASFQAKNKPEYFFANAERSRMVRRILQLTSFTKYEDIEEEEVHDEDTTLEQGHGIEQLCHDGVYESYYPLHDGPLVSRDNQREPLDNGNYSKVSNNENQDNDRKRLREEWASFSMMFKYQPLDAIRDYFGVRVGFYFAWMGVYTTFLVPAAIIGVLCFLYARATMTTSEPLKEICNKSNARLFS